MQDLLETSTKDLAIDRTLKLDNNTIHIKRNDPYGFWTIHLERGNLPEKLKGEYTSFERAERDAVYYFEEKNRKVEPVKM